MNYAKGTIIIAGASQGLGENLAKHLLENNYSLILLARNKERIQLIESELKHQYKNATITTFAVDLTNNHDVRNVFAEIVTMKETQISGLINCASTWAGGRSIYDISAEEMAGSINLNFFTYFNPIKALLDLPDERIAKPLNIINIGATASIRGGS